MSTRNKYTQGQVSEICQKYINGITINRLIEEYSGSRYGITDILQRNGI